MKAFLILLLVLNLMDLCVKSQQCMYYNYFNYPDKITIRTKQNHLDLGSQLKIGIGFWMIYKPFQAGNLAQNPSVSLTSDIKQLFVFSYQPIQSQQYSIIYYIEMSLTEETVNHKMILSTDKGIQIDNQPMDNGSYDGSWIYTYIFIDQESAQISINYYYLYQNFSKQNIIQGQLILNSDMESTTGGYKDITIDGLQTLNLQTYPGSIHPIIFKLQEYFLISVSGFLQTCRPIYTCYSYYMRLIASNQYMNNNMTSTSSYIETKSYALQGWIKQDQAINSQPSEQVLFRITQNQQYFDNALIGDRVLYVKYYQNYIDISKNGFSLQTYSYKTPWVPDSYASDQSDTIYVLGNTFKDLLIQWHFFTFQMGTFSNNGQPIYSVYYPTIDTTEQYTWPKQINHFKASYLYFKLGGDNYAISNFKGYLSDWYFFRLCYLQQVSFSPTCHYTCQKCTGTSSQDCISCSENDFRVYSETLHTCKCKIGYVDITNQAQCRKLNQYNAAYEITEKEIILSQKGYYMNKENIIQCDYGYFKYQNACIKCPYSAQPNLIKCADCIIYPDKFSQTLKCTFQFISQDESSNLILNTYGDQETELYTISYSLIQNQYLMQMIIGLTNNGICKQGFVLLNNICKECPKNCQFCKNVYVCLACFKGYQLNSDGQCKECLNCVIHETYSTSVGIVDIYYCLSSMYVTYDNKCSYCGNHCLVCEDGSGRCYSCENSQYFLTLDQQNCAQCSIQNCKYCFQYYVNQDQSIINSFDLSQNSLNNSLITTACAQCDTNYYYSFVTKQCEINPQDITDCQSGIYIDNVYKCIISETRLDAVQQSNCSDKYCQSCINNYQKHIESFCIQCQNGFYSSFSTGQCMQCPQNCLTCVQYNPTYRDAWKWNIRAFYHYFINQKKNHYFENNQGSQQTVVCLSCEKNYNLIDRTCKLGCSSDCTQCNTIEVNYKNQFYCNKCKSDSFNTRRSVNPNSISSCQTCPDYCQACIPRSSDQITALNPFFDQSSNYLKYSHICYQSTIKIRSPYFMVNMCKKYPFCSKSMEIKTFVYSYYSLYQSQRNAASTENKPKYLSFEAMMLNNELDYFQTPLMFEYLNQLQVQEITFNLEMIYTAGRNLFTIGSDQHRFQSFWKTNVFSLTHSTLYLWRSSKSQQTKIPIALMSRNFTIINFDRIIFQDIQIRPFEEVFYPNSPAIANIKFVNNYDPISITLINCQILQTSWIQTAVISFTSNRPQKLIIESMSLENILIHNSAIFDLQPLQEQQNAFQQVNSFIIQNSTFTNTSIFMYNASSYTLNQILNFTNVTIIKANFSSSYFINSSCFRDNSFGDLYLENIHLENLIIYNNSILFNVLNAKKFIVKNLTLINVKFLDQSSFMICNIISIDRLLIQNSVINSGYFFHIQSQGQLSNIFEIHFSQISFINNTYSKSNSFIYLIQDKHTQYNFYCQNMLLDNNYYVNTIEGKKSFIYVSYQQSSIYLDCTICSLQNLKIYRAVGLPEISIINSESLYINQLLIETKSQYFLRSLHSSAECMKQLIYLDSPFAIFVWSYQQVELDNVLIQNTLILDYQLIQLVGKDPIESTQLETVIIKNSVFKNNILIIMNENKQSSIISIVTLQQSQIDIINVEFLNNFHNQYYQNVFQRSSNTLLINAESGYINLLSSEFLNNTITNTSNSILYIWAKSVVVSNCTFFNQNILSNEVFQTNLISLKNSSILTSDISHEFQILSQGGCGYIEASQVLINNNSIQNSVALYGGAFYITLIGEGKILIENCSFINTSTSLIGNQLAQGGCLFIDSQKSSLNFTLQNSNITSAYARTQGGAIFIEPSKSSNFLKFNKLLIQSVFSIQHSFLSFSPTKLISIVSEIILTNTLFKNSESEFEMFAQKITDLQEQNIILFQTDNPLIYVQFSQVTMKDCQFENIHLQTLLEVEQGNSISLQELNILNNTIFQSPILKLNLRGDFQGFMKIKNVKIQNIIEFTKNSELPCNRVTPEFYKILCPSHQSEINISPQIIQNDLDQQNQLNCNLNSLYSIITEQIFSVIELHNLNENNNIYIENLEVSQIKCPNCQFGVLSIQSYHIQLLNVDLTNLLFFNNLCGVLGCVSIIKSVGNINLSESLPSYKSLNDSVNFKTQLTDSIFLNNQAQYGGACFFSQTNILINNTLFQKNNATMYGGSIYSDQTNLLLLNSDIVENSAQIGGGLFLKEQQLQKINELNLVIQDNKGTSFASNVYETPRTLYLSLDKINTLENVEILSNSTTILQQVKIHPYQTYFSKKPSDVLILPTGTSISNYHYFNPETNSYISLNQSLRLIVKNVFGETISNLENTKCDIFSYVYDKMNPISLEKLNISNITQSQLISQNSVTFNIETGDYNLDSLIIYFNPYFDTNLQLQLAFVCNSIQIPYYHSTESQPDNIINNYILFLNLRTFECQLGEYFNETSGGCVLCDIQQSQYSVTINQSSCSYKDETKILDILPATIQLRPHFWRAYYYSDIIEECHNLLANCQGGWFAGNPSCATGHIGALCEQCDLHNIKGEGYYSSNQSYQCSNCDQSAQNILNILFVILWTMISILITVTSTIKMIEDFVDQLKLRPLRFFTVIQSASTSVLLKVFTNYLQIISSIASFQLQIPIGITLAVRGAGNPIGSMAFSLDCYLKSFSDIPMLYFRVIWGFALAGMYIFFLFFLNIIISYLQKKKLNITFVTTTLIYVYIYLSPNLVSELSFLISYRNVSGIKWIASNVAYLYNTQQHKTWLLYFVTPTFAIIGILLPIFFWYIVYHHRLSLNTTKTKRVWGYLYNEYKLSVYFWETIKIIQKELIILILIFYEDYVAIKACLIFLLLHLYSKLSTKFKPYLTENLNQIDLLSTSICKLSIVLASSIYSAQNLDIQEIVLPFYVVLAFINFFFIFEMISKLILAYFSKLYELIDKVKAIIYHNLPFHLKKQSLCLRLLQNTSEKKQRIRQRFQKVRIFLMKQAKLILSIKNQSNMFFQNSPKYINQTNQNRLMTIQQTLHTTKQSGEFI